MASTKRTTANRAVDVRGGVIRLLKTKLTDGKNALTYEEVRRAVKENNRDVVTSVKNYDGGTILRFFGRMSDEDARYTLLEEQYVRGEKYFNIGCHIFTLEMFNRILRAAGVRTTKPQTLKAFAART